MSSFSNMDNVPVKISEKYKPPPRLYQMPQAIANKLLLPENYFNESPQFSYDFQLERKVLAKIPEWRQMRQSARDARRERKEQREQQRLREIETQHKQLLGAVSYPSAEDLSSTESDEEQVVGNEKKTNTRDSMGNISKVAATTQISSFHNILQPTILPHNGRNALNGERIKETAVSTVAQAGNVISTCKPLNAFNYKDFEDDTSSPFDNIELKTINDLDILAQVLKNTQLLVKDGEKEKIQFEKAMLQETKEVKEQNERIEISNFINSTTATDKTVNTLRTLKSGGINNVDYDHLATQIQNDNIPNSTHLDITHPFEHNANSFGYQASTCSAFPNQQSTYMPYNQPYNGLDPHHYANYNLTQGVRGLSNQNYLYTTQCNGGETTAATTFYSPTHAATYASGNTNSYLKPNPVATSAVFFSPQNLPSHAHVIETELSLKSKSVPDILKELRDEVENSEMRRSRNYSHTLDDNKQAEEKGISTITNNSSGTTNIRESQHFANLEASTQKLAKNISLMGFPLERVAKIAQIFGADDKKIVEHLIPLSELMDLGFDETKVSEALLKFDNNKEKALEYLIS